MYLILFILWLVFSFLHGISDYKDPEREKKLAQARVDRYEKWIADNHIKRYGYGELRMLKDRVFNNPDYQAEPYTREYLKNLLGYEIDYKRSHHDIAYCNQIFADVAEKEGWVMPPPGKTWQEMEPKLWIASWGSEAYYKWMHDHNKKPHWEYPE